MANETATPQSKFNEALQLLTQKKTLEGAEILRTLRNQGQTSADLDANLGRALVDLGDYGQGVPLLMNAVAQDRFASDNRADLALAQTKIENNLGVPMSHPSEWGSSIASYLRPQETLALASILLLVLCWLSLLKKITRKSSLIALIGCLILVSMGLFSFTGRSIGVVAKKDSLRAAPLESADEIMPLSPGVRLHILRESGSFVEVERPGTFRGWIAASAVSRSPF